jgi:hypothetical protein
MDWLQITINYLGSFLSIIVILLVGFIIAKLTGKIVKRVFHETELDSVLKAAGLPPLSNGLALLAEILIAIGTILFVLERLGLAIIAISIAGILIGIVILGTLFVAIRDAIPNLIIGIFIKGKIKKSLGKQVKIGIASGKLSKVRLLDSVLENGDSIHVPHVYTSKNFKRSQED